LEEWKAKGLSKPLEQQADMALVLLRSEEHLSQERSLKTSPPDICPGNVKSALDCTGNVSIPEQDNGRSRHVSADLFAHRKGDDQKTGHSDQACPLSKHVSGSFHGEEVRGEKADATASEQTLDIVVYGVGSISGSETSRCQLAFALLLRQLLRVSACCYEDLSPTDIPWLSSLQGVEV
jgi:hypothetical protein